MILIADCGSSKIEWSLLSADGREEKRFHTPGMNAVMMTRDEIDQRIAAELVPELGDAHSRVGHVYFYGAGCISPAVCGNVADGISHYLPNAKVEVYSDLLGAARALCGHEPGIACIMGTGSNSCYYDGQEIVSNVSPLGFILGDEGSGAVLGKRLVGDVLKRQLPADICEKFLNQYDLDLLSIIDRVYRKPQANKFLASLSPFIHEHIDCPEMRALVINEFMAFFRRNLCAYSQSRVANFVGSIAYYYRPLLEEAAAANGFAIGTILRAPMEGLIQYHTK